MVGEKTLARTYSTAFPPAATQGTTPPPAWAGALGPDLEGVPLGGEGVRARGEGSVGDKQLEN